MLFLNFATARDEASEFYLQKKFYLLLEKTDLKNTDI